MNFQSEQQHLKTSQENGEVGSAAMHRLEVASCRGEPGPVFRVLVLERDAKLVRPVVIPDVVEADVLARLHKEIGAWCAPGLELDWHGATFCVKPRISMDDWFVPWACT